MSRGKPTSSCAVLLLLCTVLSGSNNESKKNSSTCALQCEVPLGKTETKCTLTADPLRLNCCREEFSTILKNVTSLDLSDNDLTQIPTRIFPFCKSLTEISLSRNMIKEIKPGTFKYLGNLKSLNLSFNDLREWKVDRDIELQSLNYLDVTGNEHWLPSEQLQLKNLTIVRGIKLSEYCESCLLLKIKANAAEVNSTPECRCYNRWNLPSKWLWHDEIQYGKALDFIKVGFWPTCFCDHTCLIHQYELPIFRAVSDVAIKALFSLYVAGSVALLVNIMLVILISSQKSLRGDLAVHLILNNAVCDVLIGLFSVLYARLHPNVVYIDHLYDVLEGNHYDLKVIKPTSNIMGPILTCAVASQVSGSFIMTLDKFLKIVLATRPQIRIGKRGVIGFLILVWSLSILPVFNVGRMTYYNGFVGNTPLPTDHLNPHNKKPVGIAAGSQIVLLIIQLASFFLYLPIFIVTKKSGANVGIKREAAIAKKIALLVFTNLIFFVVPVVLSVVQQEIWQVMHHNWRAHTITEFQWVGFGLSVIPVLCLSINSVLNPFLYALRHPKVKLQFDKILTRCRAVMSECFVALREHLQCHSNAVQQENDIAVN